MIVKNIVLKVASRCNLNCSYCYIYNKGDNSYEKQPKFLSRNTTTILLEKILNHMLLHDLSTFGIVFHGGEPMLIGIEFYIFFVSEYKRIFLNFPDKKLNLAIQTNGTLLNDENVFKLKDLNIHIGISMDTTKISNDKNRVYHNERSSYNEILAGLKLLQKHTGHSGILSVIDVNYSALESYNHIKSTGAQFMDLLVPDETHDTIGENDIRGKLGTWLCEMFDLWYNDKGPKPNIRFFHAMIQVILGMGIGFDAFGKNMGDVIVVESNGAMQANDSLRSCKNGITETNYNIMFNEISDMNSDPLTSLYFRNHFELPYVCSNCPLESICAGGYMVNRYSKQNGFDNESIYCGDMIKIISHIQNKLAYSLKDLNLEPINYQSTLRQVIKLKTQKKVNAELRSF
ncbi:radical SAM protein [Sphingobacterium sp. HMA12]|uniref:radical SAM protein n=1 Tax=Sphingobacterium sp. HMA12 TaxID=2050894 RepID=UPI000CEA4B57|nr:radical SAM protein [Sphingobacterium sp. HMA12]